jgi:hypothetical protein
MCPPLAMSFARMEPYLGILKIIPVLMLNVPNLATFSGPKLRRSDGVQTAPVAKLELAAPNVGGLCQAYVHGHHLPLQLMRYARFFMPHRMFTAMLAFTAIVLSSVGWEPRLH